MSGVIDIVEAVIVIVLLDLVSGLVHWAEDTFWTESTPVLGDWVVTPNVIHHRDGAAFLRNSWFRSSWDLLLAGVLIVLMAWSLRLLTWQVCLFVLVGVNANQIHKWNHMPRSRVPAAVKLLQRARLLQVAT